MNHASMEDSFYILHFSILYKSKYSIIFKMDDKLWWLSSIPNPLLRLPFSMMGILCYLLAVICTTQEVIHLNTVHFSWKSCSYEFLFFLAHERFWTYVHDSMHTGVDSCCLYRNSKNSPIWMKSNRNVSIFSLKTVFSHFSNDSES